MRRGTRTGIIRLLALIFISASSAYALEPHFCSRIDCVGNFGRWFHRAAGRVTHLAGEAARAGRQWFHGVSRCRQAFA